MPLKNQPVRPRWTLLGSLVPHPRAHIPESWKKLLAQDPR